MELSKLIVFCYDLMMPKMDLGVGKMGFLCDKNLGECFRVHGPTYFKYIFLPSNFAL